MHIVPSRDINHHHVVIMCLPRDHVGVLACRLRIAVVGGAPLAPGQAEQLPGFDVIVRMNSMGNRYHTGLSLSYLM